MEYWLRCMVSPGLFNDEYAVQGEAYDGKGFSIFAPDKDVDANVSGETPVEGRLRVSPISQKGRLFLVGLPGLTLFSPRAITVYETELEVKSTAPH